MTDEEDSDDLSKSGCADTITPFLSLLDHDDVNCGQWCQLHYTIRRFIITKAVFKADIYIDIDTLLEICLYLRPINVSIYNDSDRDSPSNYAKIYLSYDINNYTKQPIQSLYPDISFRVDDTNIGPCGILDENILLLKSPLNSCYNSITVQASSLEEDYYFGEYYINLIDEYTPCKTDSSSHEILYKPVSFTYKDLQEVLGNKKYISIDFDDLDEYEI
jgi:hypothetical protein